MYKSKYMDKDKDKDKYWNLDADRKIDRDTLRDRQGLVHIVSTVT